MRLRMPDAVYILDDRSTRAFQVPEGGFDDVSFALQISDDILTVDLCADKTPVRFLRLRWHFISAEARNGEQLKIYGDAWERAYGNLEWRGIVPERCMPWFFMVSTGTDARPSNDQRRTESFGVKTGAGAMCFWQYDAAGITLWLDTRAGGEGVILKGRTLRAAEILFREYAGVSAAQAGRAFCKAMCARPILPKSPVYGANNWYYAYGESSSEQILSDARSLKALCAGNQNRPFMVIDDGWSPNPKNGPWTLGNARFPDMARLADEIRAMDVQAGIWTRFISDEGHVLGAPEAWHIAHHNDYLDPSREDVLDYIRETARRFTDWGYTLIKYDCSTQDILGRRGYRVPYTVAEDGWRFYDNSKTSAEIITNFYKAVREAAGESTVLIGCAVIPHLCAGYAEIVRTGADINGMSWDITRRNGVNALAFREMMNGTFFACDADCVGITDKIPWDKVKLWLDILSKSGTPMFVSCAPELMNAEMREALARAYLRNSTQNDVLTALDWMENTYPARWSLNGDEIHYDWFADEIPNWFAGKSL